MLGCRSRAGTRQWFSTGRRGDGGIFIRSYHIVVDGEERATIRRGDGVAVTLAPGRHMAQVRIAWTGSPSVVFHVRAEETIRLRIEPAGGGFEALDQVSGTTSWLRLSIDEAAD